ncbi:MAG: anti-sigma F factor [bacterium]|nr:anti-sigma F factor [bacterium]
MDLDRPDNMMRLEFLNLPANVGVARNAVATFAAQAEFTLSDVEEIRLAVSEAVTNAVVHAYPGRRGWVRVNARLSGSLLELTVDDDGQGIADVALARQASYTTDPERMGLGFSFMEAFSDRLEVGPGPAGGTRVFMVKQPAAVPREEGSSSA